MKEPVLTMSTHVGTSIFPDRLRCDAYADMKASALEYYLSPKKICLCYTHLMSRTPGMLGTFEG